MPYLHLTFSGALQHYADKSVTVARSNLYPSCDHPTKDAVIGTIGAAMGLERGDKRLGELCDALDVKYRVRSGKQHIIEDFQTVGSDGVRFRKADGTSHPEGRTIIKLVEYVVDTAFDVYVGGNDALLKEIYDAFLSPVFAPYLGKRSCIPNRSFVDPVFALIQKEDLSDVSNCS